MIVPARFRAVTNALAMARLLSGKSTSAAADAEAETTTDPAAAGAGAAAAADPPLAELVDATVTQVAEVCAVGVETLPKKFGDAVVRDGYARLLAAKKAAKDTTPGEAYVAVVTHDVLKCFERDTDLRTLALPLAAITFLAVLPGGGKRGDVLAVVVQNETTLLTRAHYFAVAAGAGEPLCTALTAARDAAVATLARPDMGPFDPTSVREEKVAGPLKALQVGLGGV